MMRLWDVPALSAAYGSALKLTIARYFTLAPVIDGVEGTYAKAPGQDPNLVKFVGNVPAQAPAGGTLRHKGWRASRVDLPNLPARQDATIIAPAEIEIE